MILCQLPYTSAIIDNNGNVFPCCFSYCSSYSFGNILKDSFDNIWNGQKAQEFRKQFKYNNFKYCKTDICLPFFKGNISMFYKLTSKRPSSILMELDHLCNIKCIFCGGTDTKINKELLNFEKWVDDVFKDVEYVNFNCSGEALSSPNVRKLMKYLSVKFPKLKYDILTNGLLFNQETLSELNITDKLNSVGISFHSLQEKNYNKMVFNSNFKTVINNVHYAIELKKRNKINTLEFRFVITVYNYKEMIDFAKFAKKNNANAIFMKCIQHNNPDELFKKINVINPEHEEYNNFVQILKHPIFKENFIRINNSLFDLKKVR